MATELIAGVFAAPAPLYRPTWVARTLAKEADNWFFINLLRQVAPERFAALPERSGAKCFRALVEHCGMLFPFQPLNDSDVFKTWDGQTITICTAARADGILVEYLGYEYADYHNGSDLAAMVFLKIASNDGSELEGDNYDFFFDPPDEVDLKAELHQAGAWSDQLGTIWDRPLTGGCFKPPRGRAWIQPWDGLADYLAWLTRSTGSLILDYSCQDIADMEDGYPRWDAEEIASLANDWKMTAPRWARIDRFATHMAKAKGAERAQQLVIMAKLLTGDATARLLYCEKAAPRPRTLAEVFTKGSNEKRKH